MPPDPRSADPISDEELAEAREFWGESPTMAAVFARLDRAESALREAEAAEAVIERFRDVAAEHFLKALHGQDWYIGSATTEEWERAYEAVDWLAAPDDQRDRALSGEGE